MAAAGVTYGRAAMLGFDGVVCGDVFVVVAAVCHVILGVGEVTVVNEVLDNLQRFYPARHQGDAQQQGDEVAEHRLHGPVVADADLRGKHL